MEIESVSSSPLTFTNFEEYLQKFIVRLTEIFYRVTDLSTIVSPAILRIYCVGNPDYPFYLSTPSSKSESKWLSCKGVPVCPLMDVIW